MKKLLATKIIAILLASVIVLGGLGFTTYWTVTNWEKVKAGMGGTGLYTQDDITNAYKDGYDTALSNKSEYETLLDGLQATLLEKSDQLILTQNQLTILTNNQNATQSELTALQNLVAEYTAAIAELTRQMSYYEVLLAAWENSNKYKVNFLVNGQAHDVQIIDPVLTSFAQTPPQPSGDFNFMGWSLNSVTVVNPATTPITAHTNFYALINCAVTFRVSGVNYGTAQTIKQGEIALKPNDPTSDDYYFLGWTLDGINPADVTTTPITQNTIYNALIQNKTWQTVFTDDTKVAYLDWWTWGVRVGGIANPHNDTIDLTEYTGRNGYSKVKISLGTAYYREGANWESYDNILLVKNTPVTIDDSTFGGAFTMTLTLTDTGITVNASFAVTTRTFYLCLRKIEAYC